MSRINTIRTSIGNKLNEWQVAAQALEAQFDLTKENAMERVEVQKQHFHDVLERFKTEVEKSVVIAKDKKDKITAQVNHMQVQLALGKAEAKYSYETQKKNIQTAIVQFETKVDQTLDTVDKKLEKTFDVCAEQVITASNALNAELEAMHAQYEIQKAKAEVGYETIKSDITSKIKWFKEEVSDKQRLGAEKASTYEKDLTSGFARIKQAFTNLHH